MRENAAAGITYYDHAGGLAIGNTSQNNQLDGIAVLDQAQPTLLNNTARTNTQSGIVYFTNAGGLAMGNTSESNGYSGIAVFGRAHPTLRANTVRGDTAAGMPTMMMPAASRRATSAKTTTSQAS